MNKFYKHVAKIGIIILIILALHFYPEYWIDLVLAVLAAFILDLVNKSSGKYEYLSWLHTVKKQIRQYRIKKNLEKEYIKGEHVKIQRNLLKIAIEKIKSNDENERCLGFDQLSQFGNDETYEEILNLLRNGFDKSLEKQLIKTLCKIQGNID